MDSVLPLESWRNPASGSKEEPSVHPCPVVSEPEVPLHKVSGIATSMRTTEEHVENDV